MEEEGYIKRILKLDCEYLDDYIIDRRTDGAITGTRIVCSKHTIEGLSDCTFCDKFKGDDKMEDKKVRVFISQLMKDKSDEEIQAERAAVKNAIQYGFRQEWSNIIDAVKPLKPVYPTTNDAMRELFKELLYRLKLDNLIFVEKYAKEYMACFSKPNHVNMGWLEFLDSFMPDLEVPDDVRRDVFYFSKSIEVLSQADIVVFAKGWDEGRGTVLEHDVCVKYGIPYIEL